MPIGTMGDKNIMNTTLFKDSLGNLKVLDFTGELGPYAAKLYAGLGADVIHIESIEGDPLRDKGPFLKIFQDVSGDFNIYIIMPENVASF